MGRLKDETGNVYGRLTVVARAANHRIYVRWDCVCQCGRRAVVRGVDLRLGHTQSCGCLARERGRKHGHAGRIVSREYQTWRDLRSRCNNPRCDHYGNYGGRGIRVCRRWSKFENFLADMGPRPKGMSLDRIDNAGNYEPGNCRWATDEEQSRNTRANVHLTFRGRTQCAADWADELGVKRSTLFSRISSGWSIERALMTPPRARSVRKPQRSKAKSRLELKYGRARA